MMSDKKKGVDTGAGKDQSITVGEYKIREEGRGRRGSRGRKKGMWDLWR